MRYFVVLIIVLALAGCTPSQAPPVVQPQVPHIPGLSVPDTVEFGIVRVGTFRDTLIRFANTGHDTIGILSQSFGSGNFLLVDSAQKRLTIPPGATQSVRLRFEPRDTLATWGSDTIRTANDKHILVLHGGSLPYIPQSLTGLSVPDTIDFGNVRAGLSRDTNITFKNTGKDTIRITSQAFSNKAFRLADAGWSHFNIAPGTSQIIPIRFAPTDTTHTSVFDTIRTVDSSKLIILRGEAIPFSVLFPTPPYSVSVTLTGLVGHDTDGSTHSFTFGFEAPINLASSHDNEYSFTASDYHDDQGGGPHANNWWESGTSVFLRLNNDSLVIDTLIASSFNLRGSRIDGSSTNSEGLKLHGFKLTKVLNQYSGEATGTLLSTIVGSASLQTEGFWGNVESSLKSIVGYQDSAKLTIMIR